MIALQKHPVKILHLNVRSELHGDEEKTAVDIKIGFDVPNHYLDSLGDGLRAALYAAPEDRNMPVPGTDQDHLTHVRYPQLGTQKWAGEFASVGLHLHLGNGRGKGDLVFSETKFGKLTFAAKEGGTCACVARAQVLPTPDETAKLVGLLKHEVPATVDMTNAVNTDEEEGDE
ncbi:hypothetical protein R8871_02524 [Paraburkholderia graminis C4D1M]|uniref:Uncharacterized protein n=1 Tax=Paraburkholderia graminis (strain ATCC 700544 / DSM 17151 / LMG 18924 / NCIMB 13744 / C4D1M) TaxID=396598 RepID=B1G5L1_PARG4|nr:hypothetical protein [Paraburkholderia graminis]EDT08486.1 hypothetical protein BgramDRAFT_4639 [Paraburkholderia graminis C4D1M]CAB3681302.1 hypothetical protein R8871_02524 [Paraburkholderia graminis C4D1M]